MFSAHARKRARERYGLEVTDEDYQEIAEQIRDGRAIKLGARSRKTNVYLTCCQGEDLVIVFDRGSKVIISCLPIDWELKRGILK